MSEFPTYNERDESHENSLMNDLYLVGPNKPLGYLPISTIEEICHLDIQTVIDECRSRDLTTLLYGEDDCNVASGALFAVDEQSLSQLLQINKELLDAHGWSLEPLEFVNKLNKVTVAYEKYPELYTLIAWAYKDPRPEFQRPDTNTAGVVIQQSRKPNHRT